MGYQIHYKGEVGFSPQSISEDKMEEIGQLFENIGVPATIIEWATVTKHEGENKEERGSDLFFDYHWTSDGGDGFDNLILELFNLYNPRYLHIIWTGGFDFENFEDSGIYDFNAEHDCVLRRKALHEVRWTPVQKSEHSKDNADN